MVGVGPPADRWMQWLGHRRFAGNADEKARLFSDLLVPIRDQVLDACTFVQASADDLSPIEPASADIVTTRSVLIYVRDKAACFAEFARVLRPGGAR